MAKLILRQEAINDLTTIWNCTAKHWSENQADKYYEMLKTACYEIAHNSKIGKSYDIIHRNLVGYSVGRHIIFYLLLPNDYIEVIRILHERMDLKNILTK